MASKPQDRVAAREQLDQRDEKQDDTLKQQAKDQEKQQRQELSQSPLKGQKAAGKAQNPDVPAAARAGVKATAATQGGFMDQMSRRDDNDAFEGHHVLLDLGNKGVKDAFKSVGLEGHRGQYGVYTQVGAVDPDTGIPITAIVRLRDSSHALVTVPYEALSPTAPGGRV
jgi:hypothetical protein